jgi:CRISPR-associated endonuclease/helicase Cas3
MQEYVRGYWGKAQPENGGVVWHPVAYHMLDVAAAAQALLQVRPLTLARASVFLDLSLAEARALLTLIAALHDLGKFARAFQMKVPALWGEAGAGLRNPDPHRHHSADGWLIWHGENYDNNGIGRELAPLLWPEGQRTLDALMDASVAHHGRPCSSDGGGLRIRDLFGPGEAAAHTCAKEIAALLMPHPLTAHPPKRIASQTFWFSGLVTLADWVGSNQENFPYQPADRSLAEYWVYAQEKAAAAIEVAGLDEAAPAPAKSFYDLTKFRALTPMQQWAQDVPLPQGPALFIIEDVTGAGKTEAAQMLVHRLMASGRASGAFWAMPTQATANAMYERQGDMIASLFSSGTKPRLVLAHGQAKLSDCFQASVVCKDRQDDCYGGNAEDETATASCTAFLAGDKRAAMVADVGAGTVDQALLGALPVKFNTVRLFGLANKVLILDEAHAYDSYMQAEIEALLRFQAALGGSAIILSATLPYEMRRKYASAWLGLKGNRLTLCKHDAYPLATVVGSADPVETPVEAAASSRRTVPVRLVHDFGVALETILAGAEKGGACVWIRNTVDDVQTAAEALRARGVEPLIFHARFAQCDRQAREIEVMKLFGKDGDAAARCGRVLVATQVVEQSLDLDFDCMVSDLAPVDLLIQRAGRLWRHTRARPDGLPMELAVLSPEPVAEPEVDWIKALLPGTAAVYRNANVLWRTARVLARKGAIISPEGLRELVEYVYDASEDAPEALARATSKAEGEAKAERGEAQATALEPAEGYCPVAQWLDERKVSTRLIDNQMTVRLGRIVDGVIVPYANADDEWKAWALSEMRVSLRYIPADAAPPPHFAAAVEKARARWGRYERDMPLIVLESAEGGGLMGTIYSAKQATPRRIIYNKSCGLGKQP